MVRKYLKPSIDSTEKGPQISICMRSKGRSDNLLFDTKGRLRCLAKGQTLQGVELTFDDKGIPGMQCIFAKEG